MQKSFIAALTGIRFFAAMYVFLSHYGAGFSERAGMPFFFPRFLHHGYMGVSVFFVLSGFIMTHTYGLGLRSVSEMRSFYIARLARLYPVYLLALLIAWPIMENPITRGQIVAVLFMVQSWGPPSSSFGFAWITQAWTLSVELVFYLAFPVLILALNRMSKGAVAAASVLTAAIMIIFALPVFTPATPFTLPDAAETYFPLPLLRLAEFCYGMMLCRLTEFYASALGGLRFKSLLTFVTVTGIVLILSLAESQYLLAFSTVLTGLAIAQLASFRSIIADFLATRTMVLLGGASYAMYILQQPVREWIRHTMPEEIGATINPVALILVSIVVYLAFERPAQKLVRTVFDRKPKSWFYRFWL